MPHISFDVNFWNLLSGMIAVVSFIWAMGRQFERFNGLLQIPRKMEEMHAEFEKIKEQVTDEIHLLKERITRLEAKEEERFRKSREG